MKKKQTAKQMFFSGHEPLEIKKRLGIDRQTLSKWANEWMAEKQVIKDINTQQRIDYIGAVEQELFDEIKKNPQNVSYINYLTYNYITYKVK